MAVKKSLMELMWRMQQSQTIIGVLMWSLTLAGIFYPYIRDKFGLDPGNVALPMLLLFLFILGTVILIGVVFDKFRFWKEQNIVLAERNPYASYKFFPKEIHWARLWVATAKQVRDPSEELKREIRYFEMWIDRVMKDDPTFRTELEGIEGWVEKGTPLKPVGQK